MKRTLHSDFIKLGMRIKENRVRRGLTLQAVSKRARLSAGLLSKIENFRAIPSLPVLAAVARALEVDMADLVAGIGSEGETASYVLTRAEERPVLERDDAVGFFYEFLGARGAGAEIVEACVLTITPQSRRKAVTTDGEQFIFILEGEIEFIYGREKLPMTKGDALFFDGAVPHTPKCIQGRQASLLAIYILNSERDHR
ncbi:helix-turn-helix transcriptional regulator [bacterium]|nr:helix-turn-helix transcriptional regulator [bacterium]